MKSKVRKLLSIWIVVGVCLALMLVPAPTALAAADCGIEVQPALKQVDFNETFSVSVTISNSAALPLNAVQAFLSFDNSMLQVNSITYAGTPFTQVMAGPSFDNTTGEISFSTGTPPGTNTTATAPYLMTINMESKSTSGTTIISFQNIPPPTIPPRETKVYGEGLGDVLNWTKVVNGTVIIGPAFNLTVTSVGCCPITVGSLGTVAANSSQSFIVPCPSVTLTAVDSACCVFDNWTVDAGAPNITNPIVVTSAANSSHTAVATCSVPQYNLTMAVTGNGTTTPSGSSTRSCGEVVPITATANPGWWFVNWTTADMSEIAAPTDNSTTVTMDKSKTVTANFAQRCTLTMAVTGNGTTDPAVGNHTYGKGTVVNISANPDSGWQFVNWTTANMSEIANSTAQSTTVTVDANKTVTANFAINRYNLTINSTNGGNVTTPGEGTFGPYNHGTVVNLIATPDTDYAFAHWSGDNGTIADVNSTTTSITMSGNYSISANFGALLNCTCGDICVNTTGWWRDGDIFHASATPIQSAVDNAIGGDTICVKDGTYTENVDVNTANLTIKSENGTANCVVNATNPDDHVFYVTANWVNITGFTVENATGGDKAGIYLDNVQHCSISSNNATDTYDGICLHSSSDNNLTNNTASNNDYHGIFLWGLSSNTLTNNTASNNAFGIYLLSSSNNTLANNTASNNAFGIFLWGSNNNTLTNNNATNNANGIFLFWSSSNNTLTSNTASSNTQRGIRLDSSSNNTLTNNTASNNSAYGIRLESSSDNTIYNNYFNNTNNARDDGNNTWNTTKQAGTNIIGGPYLGGNYWSDYAGSDTDGDGLGNTLLPYNCTGNIQNGGDYLPLLGATLEGHVNFTGRGSAPCGTWIEPFVVRFFQDGNETAWSPINATTNTTGVFVICDIVPGTYDIGVKSRLTISRLESDIVVAGITPVDFGTLLWGDVNSYPDWIDIDDYIYTVDAFDSIPSDGNWNEFCDFNRNSWIDIDDYIVLVDNFDKVGEVRATYGIW